ncbi:MAG: hypothetical protein ACTH0V_00185 [Microbacteriaceae bacterium]
MPVLYDLTRYTGARKNEGRRMVIATVETDRRGAVTTGLGFLITLPFIMVALPFIGGWALLLFLIGIPAVKILLARRREGLQVSNLQALNDRLGAKGKWSFRSSKGTTEGLQRKTGIIILAGRPLDKPQIIDLVPAVIPNPDYQEPDLRERTDEFLGFDTATGPETGPTAVPVHALGRTATQRTAPVEAADKELPLL